MPDNKIECRSCGFVIFDKDPLKAAKGFCVNCGQIVGWNPPSVPPKVLCGDGALLTSCHGCGHNLSKRASTCPQCSAIRVAECHICKKMIPANSDSCPECGDPKPFGELADALTTPKNLIIDPSPTAKKQSNNNKDKSGKDSENLGTRWLTFWNYFSLPVGGLLGLFAGVGLLKLSYLWGFVIISVSILQLMTAFEMRKRTFWAWQMNWVVIVFMLVGTSVPPAMYISKVIEGAMVPSGGSANNDNTRPDLFEGLGTRSAPSTSQSQPQVTPDLFEGLGTFEKPYVSHGTQALRDSKPQWGLNPEGSPMNNLALFVFRLIVGGVVFLWPSYVYWNKRKGMFVNGE